MYWSMDETAETFSCGDVCECTSGHEGIIADCSRRNLWHLPARLSDETQYL